MSAAKQDKGRLALLARLPVPEPDQAQRQRAIEASRERFASASSGLRARPASGFWQRLRDGFGKLRSAWVVPLGALATASVLAVAVVDWSDDRHVAGDPSPEVGKLARSPQQDAADDGRVRMGARPTPAGPMLDRAPPARWADDAPLQTWVAGDLRLGYRATSKGLELYEMPPGGEPRALGGPVQTGETTASLVDALRVTGPAGEAIAVRLDVPQPGTARSDHTARLRWIVFQREGQGFSRSAELERLLQNEDRLIDAERRLEEALRQK